ncbi:hypothetical protein Q7P37_000597 [Cladosporium fusiforme]
MATSTPGQPHLDMFTITKSTAATLAPRLARLALPGRNVIETPHYIGLTSRGVVPHLSQDNFAQISSIKGVYTPLEDFIERKVPPIYLFRPKDGSPPLRRFTALPDQTLLILGARRTCPVIAPPATSNTNDSIAVSTLVGFKMLKNEDYAEGVEKLGADIVLGLGDVPHGRALGSKRIMKATDRSIEWLQDHVARRKKHAGQAGFEGQAKLFAPLLPLSCQNQQFYIECLTEELRNDISGLAIYSSETLQDLPDDLSDLPRLDLTEPMTPLDVLRQIGNGVDIVTLPFVSIVTDAGIALDFTFPGPSTAPSEPLPLGIDLWSASHATDLSPLKEGCTCYACTDHHRAFLQHLLVAKEMLGWVLLQVHNHHMIDQFFASIRASIAAGTFDADVQTFSRCYDAELPEKTGQGPRVRGYQFRSEGPGEAKKNPSAFNVYDNSGVETPVAPEASEGAGELEGKGFAEKEV